MINDITYTQIKSSSSIFSPPHTKQNNRLVLQPLLRWRLVSAKYLSTNYPQTLSLPGTAGAAWKRTNRRSSAEVDALEPRQTREKGDAEKAAVDGDEIEVD